jgi:hypothetical protein
MDKYVLTVSLMVVEPIADAIGFATCMAAQTY